MSATLDDKTQKIFDSIKELSFVQTASLVKAFEEEFGISAAAAPVAVAAAPAGGGDAAADDADKTFTVFLAEIGGQKIDVLKVVRSATGLGLKEAKDLVEAAPTNVKADLKKDEAEKLKKELEAVGAKVELK